MFGVSFVFKQFTFLHASTSLNASSSGMLWKGQSATDQVLQSVWVTCTVGHRREKKQAENEKSEFKLRAKV